MSLTGNSFGAETRKEEWEIKLQETLADETLYKQVCNVKYTDTYILHNPYRTDPEVQSGTRDQAYTHQAVTLVDDDATISTFIVLPQYIDRADLAQQTYEDQMSLAENQGRLINEYLDTAMLASHASWTDFDNSSIGGSAGQITVSETNVIDIINGVIREIQEAKGSSLLARNGGFIIWRPADFEKLKLFMMSNGYNTADMTLQKGATSGVEYGGLTHYVSNRHTANHLFAGVKKQFMCGICRATFGQVVVVDEPATADGAVSAVGVISRADYIFKAWNNTKAVLFDISVA
jgi:hypothetical protein